MRIVDVSHVEHFAYPTARRTLCLDRLVSECSAELAPERRCPTCAVVRAQLKRPGSRDADRSLLRGWVLAVIARVTTPCAHPSDAADVAFPWKF